MAIRFRYRGGESAGKVLEFSDDVERITIGRDPVHCQILFPAGLTVVGREHCSLRRVLGRYHLVLRSDAGVLLDGKPARDDQQLPLLAELQLGSGGPTLVVETLSNLSLPATIEQGQARPGHGTLIARLTSTNRTLRILVASVIALVALLAAWTIPSVLSQKETQISTKDEVEAVKMSVTDLGAKIDKTSLAMGDLSRLSRSDALAEHLERAGRSVYQILLVRTIEGRDEWEAVGTAWVVEDGDTRWLATNAHVAKSIGEALARYPEHTVIARSSDRESQDIRLDPGNFRVHPGYDAFHELVREFMPVTGEKDVENVFLGIGVCDVALLSVVPGDRVRLGPPLSVSEIGARSLRAGSLLGSCGFPTEGTPHWATTARPALETQTGRVTAATDFFFSRNDPSENLVIHHSIPGSGGSSGSPIFDAEGSVVALFNMGTLVEASSGRAASGAGFNYAQRVDLLVELLTGQASSRLEARVASWRAYLQQHFASGRERIKEWAQEIFEEALKGFRSRYDSRASSERVLSGSGRLSPVTGAETFAIEFPLEMDPKWVYLVLAVAIDDIDLIALAPDGSEIAVHDGIDSTPYLILHGDGTRVLLRVESESQSAVEYFVARILLPDWRTLRDRIVAGRGLGEDRPLRRVSDRTNDLIEETYVHGVVHRFARAGRYFVIAVSHDGSDIDLVVGIEDRRIAHDEEIDSHPAVVFEVDAGAAPSIYVIAHERPVEFELNIYWIGE